MTLRKKCSEKNCGKRRQQWIFFYLINPLPDMPILGSSSSVANKGMMSKIGQMGIELSDSVENIVGKGEIARYKQFLLFPQCFHKLSVVDASKSME